MPSATTASIRSRAPAGQAARPLVEARMANDHLYLHEIIHISGTGSEAYKRHTAALGLGRRDGGSPLVGTFQQSGSTGDWPKVINLWEMGGWEHWAEILERQYTRTSGQVPELRKWWTEATSFRSGGFDRILEPAPFSPTRAEILARKVRGLACLQEIATTAPGKAEHYLEAVAKHWRKPAAKRGLTLIGAYRTAMRDTEAVLLWSIPGFRDYTRHLSDFWTARDVRAWSERARKWRLDYRETLLVPSAWCITHPDFVDAPPDGPEAAAPVRRRRGARRS
jgi:NIPSNAP